MPNTNSFASQSTTQRKKS